VAQITWQPDYDSFFYQQLYRRARTFYLFREEYIFDLERGVIIETPELGHATYVFAKPKSMAVFLAIMRGPPRNTFSTTEAMWPNAWATWARRARCQSARLAQEDKGLRS